MDKLRAMMFFCRTVEAKSFAAAAQSLGVVPSALSKMISALERLKAAHEQPLPDQLGAFGISGGGKAISRLFMTHPPLDERIAALRSMQG
mgnify:CR=1 FL=1